MKYIKGQSTLIRNIEKDKEAVAILGHMFPVLSLGSKKPCDE